MNKETMIENFGTLLDMFESFIEAKVNEKFNEAGGKKLNETIYQNATLTKEELCERWSCCKNTIWNMERAGIISPLPLRGKRNVYSMADVLKVEMIGSVKKNYKLVG